MMEKMTTAEACAFLSHGMRTGKLATVRADGRPHVVPVWFLLDGDELVFTTWHTSVKAAHLQRDGRIALCVDNENLPYDFVLVEGTATISEDVDDLRLWATKIAARYMGEAQAEAYGRRNGVPGEWLVRAKITHIVGQKEVAL
ncbi:MAG: PPOX class F420-dependent oxidoreductase [Ardenticatenaceae bacterium]|nr:PPOX class F420-dependent oxidoreductase [Ardenticatenaceae bacterium]